MSGTIPGTIKVKSEMDLLRKDRLPSFKSRDLTLGGLGNLNIRTNSILNANSKSTVAKKEFKPNLNVTRNKNTDVRTSRDTSGGRGRGGARGDRGGRNDRSGNRSSTLIQTQGLFSEGAGALNIKRQVARSYGSRDASAATEILRKPTLNKKDIIKVDVELENKQIKDILGDDDDDDFEDDKSSNSSDKMMPISLDYYKIKHEVKNISVKLEGIDTKSEESFDDFVQQQTSSSMFLMQLPDTLPAKVSKETTLKMDVDGEEKSDEPNTNFCTMHDLPEGRIGQLVRYKSGKMRLILGDGHTYDVTHGIESAFLQEIVSINTNREERSGSIVNLGKVQSKLTVTPDWPKLFVNDS